MPDSHRPDASRSNSTGKKRPKGKKGRGASVKRRKMQARRHRDPSSNETPPKGESGSRHERKDADGPVRLNKYIAQAGLCSRREADVWIAEGRVTIDGETVTTLGVKVTPDQDVRVDGR
ncbi:MAG: S4 domain-containing protein, partial [Bacteroidota bacterium]